MLVQAVLVLFIYLCTGNAYNSVYHQGSHTYHGENRPGAGGHHHGGQHSSHNAPPNNLKLEEVAGWKYLRFLSNDGSSQEATNALSTGVTRVGERLFISVPRFREGVPATLTWLPHTPQDLKLQVYPNWTWQNGHTNNCSGLVSVFRSRVDSCGRLWAIDSGAVLGGPGQGCGPKLVVIDLNTNSVVRVINIPSNMLVSTSMLSFIIFDIQNQRSCNDMYVYIADARGFGVIVYDIQQEKMWRFEHESMRRDPDTSTYTIAGETATTRDGINSMAISNNGTHRLLYFHGLSSRALYAVPTSSLRFPGTQLHVEKVFDKTSPAVAIVAGSSGILYYVPVADTAVVSFNPRTKQEKTIITDTQKLQFVSDMTLDSNGDIWLVSNRFQSFASGTYDQQDTNLRILRLSRSHRRAL